MNQLVNNKYVSLNIAEESRQLIEEQKRVMSTLARGEYTPSHCCYVIYSEDKPHGYWNTERLPELLERTRQNLNDNGDGLCIVTLWNDNPDRVSGIDDEESIPADILKAVNEGTLLNLSDFLQGCCMSKTLVETYEIEIAVIVLNGVEDPDETDYNRVFSALHAITETLANTKNIH